MLKIRVQGTTIDIKWFTKILERNTKLRIDSQSEILPIIGSNKYCRRYFHVNREEK